jgi:hypothetical protein
MKKALRAVLTGAEAVTALVPPASIVWGKRQGLPAIVLHLIDGPRPDMTTEGPSGLTASLVQLDCWGKSDQAASDIADAVRPLLTGLRRDPLRVFVEGGGADDPDLSLAALGAEVDANFHRYRLDLRVWHRNP